MSTVCRGPKNANKRPNRERPNPDHRTLLPGVQEDLDLADDVYRQCREAVPLCNVFVYVFSPDSGRSLHLPRTGASDELCAMLAQALGRETAWPTWS